MSRYLNNPGEVPPKAWPEQREQGFAWKHMETNVVLVAPSWKDLLAKVQRFHLANNFPITGSFQQDIQDQLCSRLPESWCSDLNPNRTEEVPRDDWPLWAKTIALAAKPEDAGVGDTIARVIGPTNSEAFQNWFEKIFGRSCNCSVRHEQFNTQYPYTSKEE